MCISNLMVSYSEFRCGDRGLVSVRGDFEFSVQFFESSKEEIIGRERKKKALWRYVGKHH